MAETGDTGTEQQDDGPGGALILSDETMHSLTWHHSVEFDGYEHTTACGRDVDCDDVRDVLLDPDDGWNENVTPSNGCPTCHKSVHENRPVDTDIDQDGDEDD